jgi:hypothetical protein
MDIYLRGDKAVPMIIAKRYVKTEPKIINRRRFVGLKQGIGTLLYKSIELLQECFWDIQQEVEDKGESEVVHYVIDISDDPGAGAPELVVTKLVGNARPGCGVYCEVVSPNPVDGMETADDHEPRAPAQAESVARMVQPKRQRPQ